MLADPAVTTDRLYPMPAPQDDTRFTYGLLADVVRLLERHGYPGPTSGGDLVALQGALFGFLYALSCGCHGSQRDHICIPFN